jgi:hypothetical protein
VHWDGGYDNAGDVTPMDFQRADIHVSATPDFVDDETTLRASMISPRGGHTFLSLAPGVWYVHLIIVSQSGQWSNPSLETSGESLPVQASSDGDAPADAPDLVVVPGPGFFVLRTNGVVNADATTYKYYASTLPGFAALDGVNLVQADAGPSLTVRRLAGDDPLPGEDDLRNLLYGVTYYFRARAVDADGEGPLSAEVSATMTQTDGSAIAPDSIATQHIVSGAVVAAHLEAEMALVGKLIAGAPAGRRVQLDPITGLQAVASDDEIIFDVPTEDGQPIRMRAEVIADELDVAGGATFRSSYNEIARDSGLTFAAGVTAPTTAPTGQNVWDQVPLEIVEATGSEGTFALNPNEITGAAWDPHENVFRISQKRSWGSRLWRYNPDGSYNSLVFDVGSWEHTSFTRVGTASYDFFKFTPNGKFYIMFIHAGDFFYNEYDAQNPSRLPVIGQDASGNLIVAETLTNGQLRVARVNVQTTTPWGMCTLVSAVAANISKPIHGNLTSIYMGTFDYGGSRVITAQMNNGFDIWVANGTTSGGQYPWIVDEQWPSPHPSKKGMIWDGTQFWTLGSDGTLYKHTGNKWTTESSTWWLGQVNKDTDAGGTGTYTTKLGKKSSFNAKKRAKYQVQLGPIGDFGGADDPNVGEVYLGRDPAPPLDADMHLQGSTAGTTLLITSPNFSGAAPPTMGTFPNSNSGYAESAKLHSDLIPGFWVDGSFDGRWVSEDWHQVGAAGEPAFLNGFTALAGYPVRFHITRTGTVHMVGYAVLSATTLATSGTRNIFTLPAAYRPSSSGPSAIAWKADMGNSAQLPQIAIFPDGTVRLFNNSGSTLAAAAQISLVGSWSVR